MFIFLVKSLTHSYIQSRVHPLFYFIYFLTNCHYHPNHWTLSHCSVDYFRVHSLWRFCYLFHPKITRIPINFSVHSSSFSILSLIYLYVPNFCLLFHMHSQCNSINSLSKSNILILLLHPKLINVPISHITESTLNYSSKLASCSFLLILLLLNSYLLLSPHSLLFPNPMPDENTKDPNHKSFLAIKNLVLFKWYSKLWLDGLALD